MSISYSNSNVGMCGFFGIAVCEHAVGFSFFCDTTPPAPKKELLLIMINSPHSDIMIYF